MRRLEELREKLTAFIDGHEPVLLVQGPREALARALLALAEIDARAPDVVLGFPRAFASAEAYAERITSRVGECLRRAWGERAAEELAVLSHGQEPASRVRCALGLLRDALPRRRPPLRLVCALCPLEVGDAEAWQRFAGEVIRREPGLPWCYGIRLLVGAPGAPVAASSPGTTLDLAASTREDARRGRRPPGSEEAISPGEWIPAPGEEHAHLPFGSRARRLAADA